MTPEQKRCLDAIILLSEGGVPPSFDELRLFLGLASKNGVYRLVHGLAERGHITFKSGHARSIRVISKQEAVPFDRLAEAALKHVRARWEANEPISHHTMRDALVEAFKAEAA